MKKIYQFLIPAAVFLTLFSSCNESSRHRTLIITGQNNHNWKVSSPILKQILEETGLFSAEIMITPDKGGDMKIFNPDFAKYRLVVIDYNGDSWPDRANTEFVEWVRNGGGVVIYHAADNSFPAWKEYNEMTGLGGWGDRNQKDGPYVYYKNDQLVTDTSAGIGGAHGRRREYIVRARIADHPIIKGLPDRWLHGTDELYSLLRGPAKNMQVLATAFADSAIGGGTMRDEPVLMTITYGKGRIFHTAMGHADDGGGPAMHCAGFITTFQRGAEWAVTGEVNQKVPWDFPGAAGVVLRPVFYEISLEEAVSNIGNYDLAKSTKYISYIQSKIRSIKGDENELQILEKMLLKVIKAKKISVEARKLLLRELSWMGSEHSISAIQELSSSPELKDETEVALTRLRK